LGSLKGGSESVKDVPERFVTDVVELYTFRPAIQAADHPVFAGVGFCFRVYSDPARRERNPYDLSCCLAVAYDLLLSFAQKLQIVQSGSTGGRADF